MGMTMTQKILAKHAGLESVRAGQLIQAKLDLVLGNDITTPVAINEFESAGFEKVFDKSRIAMVMDHFAPNKDIKSATQCKQCRTFARRFDIDHFYDVGTMGIEHALLPEQGLVAPGEAVIGADSHTCTYGALGAFSTGVGSTDMGAAMAAGETWFKVPSAIKVNLTGKLRPFVSGKDVILTLIGMIGVDGARYQSIEFSGEGVKNLTIYDRLTICNMAIEAGGKNGIFPVDDVTRAYVEGRVDRPWTAFEADPDAEYERVIDIDLGKVDCTVAWPHLPENAHSAREGSDIKMEVKDGYAYFSYPGLERCPGAVHAALRRRRALRFHHQPQLCRPHGPRRQRGLPRLSGCRRGVWYYRPHFSSGGGHEQMNAHGIVHKYGDHVDTDVIIPARYLNTQSHKELASHCMEDIDKDFIHRVKDGDIMVAGVNFGCGSSREHAPVAIKASGISCVIAANFARIFYRNAINIGLAILECPAASAEIENGDEVTVDFDTGVITDVTKGTTYQAEPFPPFIKDMIARGGLMASLKAKEAAK